MVQISQEQVYMYWQRADNARTQDEKGRALEDLISYLFGTIPGIELRNQDVLDVFLSDEIDLAFWNNRHPEGLWALTFPDIIFIECKNWAGKVGSHEVRNFTQELQERSLHFGVLIATNGVTGDPHDLSNAHHAIAFAQSQGYRIIVITRTEIETITTSVQLVNLVKQKLCDLIVSKTCFIVR